MSNDILPLKLWRDIVYLIIQQTSLPFDILTFSFVQCLWVLWFLNNRPYFIPRLTYRLVFILLEIMYLCVMHWLVWVQTDMNHLIVNEVQRTETRHHAFCVSIIQNPGFMKARQASYPVRHIFILLFFNSFLEDFSRENR